MLHDLRYGMRILRKIPTFALVAILALALGTGANAAIFQLVNALRLRSLPVEKPNDLVSIGIDQHGKGRVGRGYGGRSIFTEPLWQEIRSQHQAFSSLFAWANGRWDLSGGGRAGSGRRHFTGGVPGNGVADIHGRLGEELHVVHAHRETCRYGRLEPAGRVCGPVGGAAWRHRARPAAHMPQSREPDAG